MKHETTELVYKVNLTTDVAEVVELVSALKDYIQILSDELDDVTPIASVHGWKSKRVDIGLNARKRIELALESLSAESNG
jgi:hypothetical protein